jgi:tryptophan 7-halogenase
VQNKPIKKLIIAGGGTAGWIAAAVLSKTFGGALDIALIESDDMPTIGVGEATIPPLQMLHRILNISEREFLAEVQGTFKLGIKFENWLDVGKDYIHSFGAAGKSDYACQFIQYWLAGKQQGIDFPFGNYCLEHLAMQQNKFVTNATAGLNYAYHFDAGLYVKLLRCYSEKNNVARIEGKIAQVNLDADNGSIKSLQLSAGQLVEGGFFIDCTGFNALLFEQALGTEYIDWSHWLPCDRALAVQTESLHEPIPYTRSIAHDAGWQWRIPLQHRVGNGLVYASSYLSDEAARARLLNNIEGTALTEPKLIKFRTGTRAQHWHKNCVAIGLSSGFLEPLESTSIHLIQSSVLRLAKLFPVNGIQAADVDEFNAQSKTEVERIRDFIILHYCVTERNDSPFWQYCRTMDVPSRLRHRIELFRNSGRVFKAEADLFGEESWMQVMLGQGVMPQHYHPAVDALSEAELNNFLTNIREKHKGSLARMPSHADFINHYCKAN